jgi:hypothetical protein
MNNNLTLSINGLYLLNEEKIYFVNEDKSYGLDDLSFGQWVNIFKENTSFALKNNLLESKEIYSFHRKMTYQLFEGYTYDQKTRLIFEYESKFGNSLIIENTVLLENWFGDAWDWMSKKFSELGGWAVTLGKNLATCLSGGGCSPFFEQFRELMFNPVSVGIQVFLSTAFPGAGNIGVGVLWGMLLLYDGYLLITNSPTFSWWNLIFDIVGVVFSGVGAAAAFRAAVGGAKVVSGTAGATIEGVISQAVANPKTAGTMAKIGGALSGLLGKLKPALDFMMNKLGLKWIGRAFKAIEDVVARMTSALLPKSATNIAKGAGAGTRASAEMVAAGAVIGGVGKLGSTSGSSELEQSVVNANKTIKPDYKNIEW